MRAEYDTSTDHTPPSTAIHPRPAAHHLRPRDLGPRSPLSRAPPRPPAPFSPGLTYNTAGPVGIRVCKAFLNLYATNITTIFRFLPV